MTNDDRPEYVKDAVGKVTLAAVNTRLAIEIARAHVGMLLASPPQFQRSWEQHMIDLYNELSLDPAGDATREAYSADFDKIRKPKPDRGMHTEGGKIRAWAVAKGYDVQKVGKLPKMIVDAYHAEHEQAQEESA